MDESLKAQLQAMLDMIPAFTWLAAPSGALLFVNSRCADYLGLAQDHPLRFGTDTGAAWDSHIPFLHPDDHEKMRSVGSDNLRTGGTAEASCRIRDAHGNYRWFLNRVEPLRATDGTVQYWIGINLDIEERKQAEFYLAEGQRLAHSGSWTFTPAGFEHWSPELFAIHGLDPAKKAPTFEDYMALVHPDDRISSRRKFGRCWRSIADSTSRSESCGPTIDSSCTVRRHARDKQRSVPEVRRNRDRRHSSGSSMKIIPSRSLFRARDERKRNSSSWPEPRQSTSSLAPSGVPRKTSNAPPFSVAVSAKSTKNSASVPG